MKFDVLVVGAGLAGMTAAVRAVTRYGKTCLVIDKREHIGGNCYDYVNSQGLWLHRYGPHFFHTDSIGVLEFLNRYTAWTVANYAFKSYTKGRYWSLPINLNTYQEFVGRWASQQEFEWYLRMTREIVSEPKNSEEAVLSKVGRNLYEMFVEGYTRKQWGREPRLLDPCVCNRLIVRTGRDNRYFTDRFQCMPADGYTEMFKNMEDAGGSSLKVELGVDFLGGDFQWGPIRWDWLVYTGSVDDYYAHAYGSLPYRSLVFEHWTHNTEFALPAVVVNYPGLEIYTRESEMKHVTAQKSSNTTVVREYPIERTPGLDPYYPIPCAESRQLFEKYRVLMKSELDVEFLGRLGQYEYLNMDQVVERALNAVDRRFEE